MPRTTLSRRSLLKIGMAAPFVAAARPGWSTSTSLKFALAAPFDGSNAAFFLGQAEGWYRDAGIDVQFDASGGSGAAVTQVGSGVCDLGVADINVMSEFNAKNPGTDVRNVYMLYFRSPLSVGTLASSGIESAADLEGRTIGAAPADGAFRLFGAFSQASGLQADAVNWDMVGLQLREAVLARGDVEAILGFDSTMYFGLLKAGIPPEDIRFLYYSDAGLNLYGNGLLASKRIREQQPEVLKAFVEVSARAWQAAIADPARAIAALKDHSSLIDAGLEEEKLRWLISNQLVTEESRADGLGGVREERLAAAMQAVATALEFPSVPSVGEVFDAAYLPDASVRALPV